MKRVLITGASGFIGRNLKESLSDHYSIFAPSHRELELLDSEQVEKYVSEHQIDVVIHAAIHVPMFHGKEQEFYNDMQMFLNLERVSSRLEKLIYFGSGAEFDKRFDIRMVTEEAVGRTIPVSEYGLAKYIMNKIARSSDNIYNFRLFGIFGKYELWQIKFLSNLCCKAVFDLPLTVRKDCCFDFLHIDDLAAITRWAVENQPIHHDYNVCMGQEYRLTELAEKVCAISGKSLEIQLLSPERNLDYSGDNTRLRTECPADCFSSMDDGLRKLYDWYAANKDMIDYELLKSSR